MELGLFWKTYDSYVVYNHLITELDNETKNRVGFVHTYIVMYRKQKFNFFTNEYRYKNTFKIMQEFNAIKGYVSSIEMDVKREYSRAKAWIEENRYKDVQRTSK